MLVFKLSSVQKAGQAEKDRFIFDKQIKRFVILRFVVCCKCLRGRFFLFIMT